MPRMCEQYHTTVEKCVHMDCLACTKHACSPGNQDLVEIWHAANVDTIHVAPGCATNDQATAHMEAYHAQCSHKKQFYRLMHGAPADLRDAWPPRHRNLNA